MTEAPTPSSDEIARAVVEAIPQVYFWPIIHVVEYDETGKITQMKTEAYGIYRDRFLAGERVIQALQEQDDRNSYVDLSRAIPMVVPRPPAGASIDATEVPADGETVLTISSALDGSRVLVLGPMYTSDRGTQNGPVLLDQVIEVEDGEPLEITFNAPGTYLVRVIKFPFLTALFEVTAT